MSTLSVSNKIFKNVDYSVAKNGDLKVRCLTSDSNYFKHDINIIEKSDPALLDAFLRNYAMTLKIDSVDFISYFPTRIRKSRIKGKRVITFKKYFKS